MAVIDRAAEKQACGFAWRMGMPHLDMGRFMPGRQHHLCREVDRYSMFAIYTAAWK